MAATFFLLVTGFFVFIKVWVYLSLRMRFINLYRYFKRRMLLSTLVISLAIFSHSVYDLVIYFEYVELTEANSK